LPDAALDGGAVTLRRLLFAVAMLLATTPVAAQ
jgi:hypothetical protein